MENKTGGPTRKRTLYYDKRYCPRISSEGYTHEEDIAFLQEATKFRRLIVPAAFFLIRTVVFILLVLFIPQLTIPGLTLFFPEAAAFLPPKDS